MSDTVTRLAAALAGRYRIERELGAGGMATVYLAEDLKHDRKVAIKVLKPELAAVLGAERFVQEIKTTAAMSHPHILPLFDSGTADGFLFYVMPFIEGETIREKLNRETQFGVDEAVRIAREVADALDYAHRHGVIHRDIKPENILLHDGRAMVMDFGIALAVSAAAGGRMTETGLSLGTPHYMSPEQATAEKEITPKSDVYSLASVLYEMLAGQPPHVGGPAQQVIMRIITEAARPVNEFRKNVPGNVVAALEKSLEKLPADRFESAKALAEALGNPGFRTIGTGGADAHAASGGVSRAAFFAAVAIAVLGLGLAGWQFLRRPSAAAPPVTRSRLGLPDSLELNTENAGSHLVISRDGAAMLLLAAPGSRTASSVWYRPSDQFDLRLLPGAEGANAVALSADGKRFAFVRNLNLFVAGVDASPPTVVAGLRVSNGQVAWSADDALIVSISGGLARVPVGGSPVQQLTTLDTAAREEGHTAPEMLPNGKGVLFTVQHTPSTFAAFWDIAVGNLRSGKHRVLARGVRARYSASGHVIYVTAEGVLMALPFDQERLEPTGSPVAVGDGVAVRPNGGVELSVSGTGTLVYLRADGANVTQRELIWVDRSGAVTPLDTAWRGAFDAVAISPSGRQVAVSMVQQTEADVWVRNLASGTVTKLSFERGLNYRPSWYPDDSRVAFISNARGTFDLVSKRADGVGGTDLVVHEARSLSQGLVSGDGKWAIYRTNANLAGGGDIGALHLGDSVPVPLVATPAEERYPALSPDGRWLAYRSSEANRPEVYVQPFPKTSDGKWTVSRGGGSEPLWSRSGKELYFVDEVNGAMMAVTVRSQPSFAAEAPRKLFRLPVGVHRAISHQAFDIAPDDRRFLMIRAAPGTTHASSRSARPMDNVIVVQNWFEELRVKAPAKRQ